MTNQFNEGALIAIGLIVATHDQPGIAADVLIAMGLSNADCSNLDEFDKRNLQAVQGERSGKVKLRGLDAALAARKEG